MTMKTPGGCWWIAALLVMAVGAEVLLDSLTVAERKAVERVRENFHNSNTKHVFQVTKILSNENKKHPEGSFVAVKFIMKRTNCAKHEWKNKYCAPIMTAKRTYNCLGCFIFNSSGEILRTGYQKCVRQSRANEKEVKEKRQQACANVQNGDHLVGKYSLQWAPRG